MTQHREDMLNLCLLSPERKQYFLSCGNSVPEAFDKEKLAKDQFDIEY